MRRLPRFLRLVLGLTLSAYLAYLVLGNVFLNTSLADAAFNRKPDRFHAQWRRAMTLWPGAVSFSGVEVKGQARRVQWRAGAEHVDAQVALLPLLRRELQLVDIAAQELQFDAQRVEQDLLPPKTSADGWIVHLVRIHSDTLRRARWEGMQADGTGSVEFGLWKQLRGGALEILPSRLQLHAARITQADEPWLQQADLDARFALPRHRVGEAPGAAKLNLMQATVTLRAEGPHVSGALGSDDWLRLDVAPGGGQVEAVVSLTDGELQPGGRVALQVPIDFTDAAGVRRDQRLAIDLAVDEGLALCAVLPAQAGGIGSLDANLRLGTRRLPLDGVAALLPLLDGEVALDGRFESLRWLSAALVHNDWLSFDGAGQLNAQLKIARGRLAIGSRIEIPVVELSTRVLEDRIRGQARARGELVAGQDGAEPRAQVRIDVARFAIASEAEPDVVYVQGRDLHLALDATGDLARLRETLNARLNFRQAEIPDLTAYNRYLPKRNLAFIGGRGRLDAEFELDAAGLLGKGRMQLKARRAALRVSELALRGDVALDAHLSRVDLEGRRFDLRGTTLHLDNVGYSQGDESGAGWWARIALPRSSLRWGRPLQVDGNAEVRMKDVGFLLALFSQRRHYPKWVLRLIDAGEATLRGQAQLRGDALVLDRLQAENRRFEVRGRLRLHDTQRRGDLLLTWGVFDVGVELRDAERRWHLRKAEAWFEQGQPLLRAPE